MGARRFRLAAVVTILVLMPLFINQINHLLYMVSYDNSVNLFTNLLSSVGSAAFMFFIGYDFCSVCCSLLTYSTAFGSSEA